MTGKFWAAFAAVTTCLLGAGCASDSAQNTNNNDGAKTANAPASDKTITGAGASFPALLYQKWAQQYQQTSGVQVNYQSIGSSGGIKNTIAKAVDFGATDGPMTEEELAQAPGVLHIPTVAGAVVIGYNVPNAPNNLKLTGPVVADIYLGKITRWNDPAISGLNAGVSLPDTKIVPAFRSDGSGTTNILTDYLSKVSPEFKEKIGVGKSVRFPAGIGGKGNEGVAASIQQTPGGFGYIELAYAQSNKINYASIRNAGGSFVVPSLESTTKAAEGAELPDDFRAIITNTKATDGYPISGFTWVLVHKDAAPETKAFLKWALTEGQKSAAEHGYSPLPENVRKRALTAVETIE